MPSLVFTGDKINAERESKAERRLVCSCLFLCACVCLCMLSSGLTRTFHVPAPPSALMHSRSMVCMLTCVHFCVVSSWVCVAVHLCVHLALDDVVILVDLQDVSRVAGDGTAVSVVEVAAGATAL